MRKVPKPFSQIFILIVIAFSSSIALAATDGYYTSQVVPYTYDGTDAKRQTTPSDYTYTYGDEASVTYTLPWSFTFYNQPYTQITADTNGNIWFGNGNVGRSFNLGTAGGPVIAAWNNDLSSYYYGGVFIQHKRDPERVVVEYQTETYTEEGYSRINQFEVVLFQTWNLRFDYKSFDTSAGKDIGSGVSKGDGTASLNLTTNYGSMFSAPRRSIFLNSLPVASITINGSAPYTKSTSTVLTVSATDADGVAEMQFSNDNVNWSPPEPYSPSKNWVLTNGDGTKTVYARFQESLGNWSSPVSATIVLDTTPPVDSASPAGGIYYRSRKNVSFTCSDVLSGCNSVYYTLDGSTPTTASNVYKPGVSQPILLTKNTTISYFGVDNIGNAETVKKDTYVLAPCGGPTVTIQGKGDFSTIQDAYNSASPGDVMKMIGRSYNQTINANLPLQATIEGGYDCDFEINAGGTTFLYGDSKISNGNLLLSNINLQSGYVPVQSCASQAMIRGKAGFPTLQSAYDTAVDGDVIQSLALQYTEDLTLNRPISVTVDGGYACDYTTVTGQTVIKGGPRMSSGSAKMISIRVAK